MNLRETEQFLRDIAAIDGRQVTAERIKNWQAILENVPLDIAEEALKLARRDASIDYLEPKHIIAKAKQWAEQQDTEQRRQQAMTPVKREFQGIACPKCIHDSTLAECQICCREMWQFHQRHADQDYGDKFCIEFARENLYA